MSASARRSRTREGVLVPREVALAVRVLNVQPQHVNGEVMLLELVVHVLHVALILRRASTAAPARTSSPHSAPAAHARLRTL